MNKNKYGILILIFIFLIPLAQAQDVCCGDKIEVYNTSGLMGFWKLQREPADFEISNTSGLMGFWKLNNDSAYGENDTLAYDYSGNGNNGTIVGATFNPNGYFNGSYDFDGVNDFINLTTKPSFKGLNQGTIEMWVYPKSTTAGPPSLYYESTTASGYNRFGLFFNTDRKVGAVMRTTATGTPYLLYSAPLTLNQWYHIVAVNDGTYLKLYVNGALEGSVACGNCTFPLGDPINDVSIGAFRGGGSNNYYFNGTIDSVRIYNRGLTAEEVYTNYLNATGLYDYSGNGNNGAINNAKFVPECYFGGCYNFTRGGDIIIVPHSNSLEPENVTIEAWIYGRNWTCPYGLVKPIFFKGTGTSDTWGLYFDFNDNLVFLMMSGTTSKWAYIPSSNVSLNEWHYVVGTYDGDKLRLYLDGELVDESQSGVARAHNTENAWIGGLPESYNLSFDGTIDSVRIYNRALSEEEIIKNWNGNCFPITQKITLIPIFDLNNSNLFIGFAVGYFLFDQNLNTTSDVVFNSIKVSSSFYINNKKGLTSNYLINGSTAQCWLNFTGGLLTNSSC